jgi:hypothetical protein
VALVVSSKLNGHAARATEVVPGLVEAMRIEFTGVDMRRILGPFEQET